MARKILLADDSVTAQNMGRKILADAGYEVITVNNGSAALKKIAEQKPDLIVLDVYMPGYSGLEVCQRLKEVKETARIPVLLTVGKLEPFKPEECKRVRAEGYIVKPFEASELLSALSKLEDRVVPRAESSKPGRFARAIAAVEEGRSDEVADGNDADDGWKNRITFPSKKKKKQKEKEDEGEEETYNPANRDMRTIVDRPTSREIAPKTEDSRLDVAALAAAAGLPKDVTPEELAALAAAAAQVQAAVDGKESLAASAEPTVVASRVEGKAETHSEARAGATFAQQSELVRDFDVIAAPAGPNVDEVNAQGQVSGGNRTAPSDEAEKAGLNKSAIEERAIDNRETEEKGAALDEAPVPATMAVAASVPFTAVSSTHRWTAVPVGIAAEEASISLEQEMQKAYAAFATAEANQPGFMAKAPEGAAMQAPASLGPDEEEIARTLRDVAHASADGVGSALQQLEAVAETQISAVPDAGTREREAREQEAREQEARAEEARQQESREREAREREAREQAAREQEAREQEARAEEARQQEARDREAREQAAREQEAREQEARAEEARQQEAREREAREQAAREQEAREQEARAEEARQQEMREREAREQAAREQEAREQEARAEEARQQEAREREAREQAAREQEAREREAREQAAREQEAKEREEKEHEARAREAREQEARQLEVAAAEAIIAEAVSAAAQARAIESSAVRTPAKGKGKEKVSGGDMAEKENEIAATTAAAWASWRQIRESGDKSKPTSASRANRQEEDDEDYPEPAPDKAAMAVAAGAEKSAGSEGAPEASTDDPEAIASIVDKVLADLRPKIAEEISRKLKKK